MLTVIHSVVRTENLVVVCSNSTTQGMVIQNVAASSNSSPSIIEERGTELTSADWVSDWQSNESKFFSCLIVLLYSTKNCHFFYIVNYLCSLLLNSRVPLQMLTLEYQFAHPRDLRHWWEDSKNAFRISLALTQTRQGHIEVLLL